MAAGDFTFMTGGMLDLLAQNHSPADKLYLAICDNTVVPKREDVSPVLGDYTEVTAAGSYTAGGIDLGAISTLFSVPAAATSGALIVGQSYVITTFVAGDDFTNVGAASNASGVVFTATGTTPTTWTNASTVNHNAVVFDSTVNPSWTADTLNATDAYWGVIYNFTNATKFVVGFVELGGPVNMVVSPYTLTWSAGGLGIAAIGI